MMRRIFAGLATGGLALLVSSGTVAAQASTGAVRGQLVICRPVMMPVAGPDSGPTNSVPGPDLNDVTPGGNLRRQIGQQRELQEPLANIEVKVLGTPLTAVTDDTGHFTLTGVPTSQPLTVEAQFNPGPTLTLHAQNLVVNPGQTLDVGTLAVTGCSTVKPGRADTDWPEVVVQVTPSVDTTASAEPQAEPEQQPVVTDDAAQ